MKKRECSLSSKHFTLISGVCGVVCLAYLNAHSLSGILHILIVSSSLVSQVALLSSHTRVRERIRELVRVYACAYCTQCAHVTNTICTAAAAATFMNATVEQRQ